MLSLLFYGCNKVESNLQTVITNNKKPMHSNARQVGGIDSTVYTNSIVPVDLSNLESPTRDVVKFIKDGGVLPSTKVIRIG